MERILLCTKWVFFQTLPVCVIRTKNDGTDALIPVIVCIVQCGDPIPGLETCVLSAYTGQAGPDVQAVHGSRQLSLSINPGLSVP